MPSRSSSNDVQELRSKVEENEKTIANLKEKITELKKHVALLNMWLLLRSNNDDPEEGVKKGAEALNKPLTARSLNRASKRVQSFVVDDEESPNKRVCRR